MRRQEGKGREVALAVNGAKTKGRCGRLGWAARTSQRVSEFDLGHNLRRKNDQREGDEVQRFD